VTVTLLPFWLRKIDLVAQHYLFRLKGPLLNKYRTMQSSVANTH